MSSTAMHSICTTRQERWKAVDLDDVEPSDGPGRILLGVLKALEEAGIAYCLLHGYESYPQRIKSDVDCLISRKMRVREIVALLHAQRARIGADVVRWVDYYVVLAGRNADGAVCFLKLDMCLDFEYDDLPFYSGREMLQSRRTHQQFWVPAAHL